MAILIINQTKETTFRFSIKNTEYTVLPGSKNVVDIEACPLELTRNRAKGEIFIQALTPAEVAFFKTLSTAPPVASEETPDVSKQEVVASGKQNSKKTNEDKHIKSTDTANS